MLAAGLAVAPPAEVRLRPAAQSRGVRQLWAGVYDMEGHEIWTRPMPVVWQVGSLALSDDGTLAFVDAIEYGPGPPESRKTRIHHGFIFDQTGNVLARREVSRSASGGADYRGDLGGFVLGGVGALSPGFLDANGTYWKSLSIARLNRQVADIIGVYSTTISPVYVVRVGTEDARRLFLSVHTHSDQDVLVSGLLLPDFTPTAFGTGSTPSEAIRERLSNDSTAPRMILRGNLLSFTFDNLVRVFRLPEARQ